MKKTIVVSVVLLLLAGIMGCQATSTLELCQNKWVPKFHKGMAMNEVKSVAKEINLSDPPTAVIKNPTNSDIEYWYYNILRGFGNDSAGSFVLTFEKGELQSLGWLHTGTNIIEPLSLKESNE